MPKKLKVALIAPAFGQTGGPEIVTKNLAESLLEKGVDVTLFAPADWKIKTRLIPTLEKSLWNMKDFKNQTTLVRNNYLAQSQLEILNHKNNFDIIHLHSHRYAYTLAKLTKTPCVLTFHNKPLRQEFNFIKSAGIYPVFLSDAYKNKFKASAIINNGINTKEIPYSFLKGRYLIVIGRITEPKGIDVAIKIAKRAKKKLLILGRVGNSLKRQQYFNKKIRPLLDANIIFKGQVSQDKVFSYLKGAEALLFPIIKPHKEDLFVCPLVVMEALACGTPVIGTTIHPTPKPLNDPEVAFLSKNFSALVKAAKSIEKFDRIKCRKYAEKYFDTSLMTTKYILLYKKILKNTQKS